MDCAGRAQRRQRFGVTSPTNILILKRGRALLAAAVHDILRVNCAALKFPSKLTAAF